MSVRRPKNHFRHPDTPRGQRPCRRYRELGQGAALALLPPFSCLLVAWPLVFRGRVWAEEQLRLQVATEDNYHHIKQGAREDEAGCMPEESHLSSRFFFSQLRPRRDREADDFSPLL